VKVLNLYAGIGGNRKLWADCEVTAVEYDAEIAAIYKENFPNDEVIVADAHQFLLDHYKEFDFIWSSPPCPSHSRVRFMASRAGSYKEVFPDLKLYEEIIFLKHFFKGRWVVENVKPYYEQLMPMTLIDRHCFWANFPIEQPTETMEGRPHNKVTGTWTVFGFNLQGKKLKHRKDQILRNCVNPAIGLHILQCAFKTKTIQLTL
jgi:DNA (cytosine-5)-methyltransferase 1